jgi:hypothetical protein
MSDRRQGHGRLVAREAAWLVARRVGALKLAGVAVAVFAFLFVMFLMVALLGAATSSSQAKGGVRCVIVGEGEESPPRWLLPIYQAASDQYGLGVRGPSVLAGINFVETSFGTNVGTSSAGANGWMAFLPSTWDIYGVDADANGDRDPYDPLDAIFAAARYLKASGAPKDWYGAIFAYNHADWYVQKVEENAAKFAGPVVCTAVEEPVTVAVGGDALLQRAETLYRPRAFKAIPAALWVGGGSPEAVDARIWPDVIWVLRTFHLRVTAARESGHNTHGDGTATDLVPESGKGWDETARAAAETLGWREDCGASGTAPVCHLVPAIQFVGYNGYPGHGDPAHAGENAHLHISWQGASYGSGALSDPPAWVRVFPLE